MLLVPYHDTTIFIILLADISLWSDSSIHSYADDTTSSVSGYDFQELKDLCEKEAQNILNYMATNKLKANDDKTHILVIAHGQRGTEELTFKIGEAEIKESSSEKLLGAWIKNDLSWTKHLKKLEDELHYRLFKIKRMEQVIPKSLLRISFSMSGMMVFSHGETTSVLASSTDILAT